MKSASMGPMRVASKATGQLMRTMPRGSAWMMAMDSSAASASVTAKLRVERISNCVPSRSSSNATRRLNLDLGVPRARPAAAKPPCSTTLAK
jgi:hypothetical protein